MSKQTAVEWLYRKIVWENTPVLKFPDCLEQAKAMEREQIVDAWNSGDYAYFYSKETGREFEDGSEYYNETYKGGEK